MSEPIRVLQVLDDSEPGGGLNYLHQLAHWIDKSSFLLQFAVPRNSNVSDSLTQTGHHVRALELKHPIDIRGIINLARTCRDFNIQIIHSHNARANFHARIAGKLAGVPVRISTIHNSVFNYDVSPLRKRVYAFVERITSGMGSRIIAVSQGIADELISRYGIHKSKILIIPNGVDMEKLAVDKDRETIRSMLGIPDDTIAIVQVGRLTHQKGFDILLRAVSQIVTDNPQIMLLIVGEGPLRADLEHYISEKSLHKHVRLLGHRIDINEILSAADIAVLASRSEGMPYTLLEAMGLGCPIVATQIPGIEEVIDNNKTGILVPPEDSEAIASAILKLIRMPELACSLGTVAKQTCQEEYTAERMVNRVQDLYQSILLGAFPLNAPWDLL